MSKKIGVIILAAGNSVRYQGIKLLDYIDGKPMYLHALERVKQLPIGPKVIVTQYPEIEVRARQEGFLVVQNPHPEKGVSGSIRLGMEAALRQEAEVEAIMFCVGDQPYLTVATMKALVDAWNIEDKKIGCICHGNQMGNPCIYGKRYFDQLMSLSADKGGKYVLKQNMGDVFFLQVDDARELKDIDTRE
ncbi:MAG: hypothetical protein PWP24_160 [Clostridiales bacterium]|nr:hypothetical protein [Clostridiales bacterium]